MNSTVAFPVRIRPIPKTKLQDWAHFEVMPFLSQSRLAHNLSYRAQFTHTSLASGIAEAAWASTDMRPNVVWLVCATVLARAETGGAGRSVFIVRGTFHSDGAVAQEGATVAEYTQNTLGFAVAFVVSGQAIGLTVQDDGAHQVDWRVEVEIWEHPLP